MSANTLLNHQLLANLGAHVGRADLWHNSPEYVIYLRRVRHLEKVLVKRVLRNQLVQKLDDLADGVLYPELLIIIYQVQILLQVPRLKPVEHMRNVQHVHYLPNLVVLTDSV